MPRGIYIRTEECNKAHRGIKKPGSGIYQRKPEHIERLIAIGYKKGHKPNFTKEWREKIRVSLTGVNNPLFGKKLSEEMKAKLKLCHHPWHHTQETIKKLSGAKCHLWKGGLTLDMREYTKNYYAKNIEKLRLITRVRSNMLRSYGINKMDKDLMKTIQMVYEDNIKKHGTLTCYLCLKSIKFKQDSLEHRTPICRGGTNEYENLGVAHLSCNRKKHNRTEQEYRKELKNVD